MAKRDRYRDNLDPEVRRWGRTYRSFPGVEECIRLILARKAKGTWADIIVEELAENAKDDLEELIQAYREHRSDADASFVVMSLEMAALPESVEFFSDILHEGTPRFVPFALDALEKINTQE